MQSITLFFLRQLTWGFLQFGIWPSKSLILNVWNSKVQFRVLFCSGRRFTLQQPGCTWVYGWHLQMWDKDGWTMKQDREVFALEKTFTWFFRNDSPKWQQRTRENTWGCTTNWFIHYVLALNQSKGSKHLLYYCAVYIKRYMSTFRTFQYCICF